MYDLQKPLNASTGSLSPLEAIEKPSQTFKEVNNSARIRCFWLAKSLLRFPRTRDSYSRSPPILLLVLLSESFNSPPQMPSTGTLRMQIWPHRNGRHLLSNKGPIKVLRGKHWRYMKRRLGQFAKAYKKKWGADLSGRLIWREGNRKHQVEQPWGGCWCDGVTCAW